MWAIIKGLLPGAGALSTLMLWVSIISAISGALVAAYKAIKAQGAAEVQAQQLKADYDTLQAATGEAITKLNAQYAAKALAAAERQRQWEQIDGQATAEIEELRRELDDARSNGDACIDKPLPVGRAERVRKLAREAGSGG